MRNHHEKTRDMARSVLPSSRRKSARSNLASLKRRHRRRVRQTLHDWRFEDNAYDYEGFANTDTNRATHYDDMITYIVDDRRNYDKLSIVHWAERLSHTKLRGMPQDQLYYWFKKNLPDNLIGRHALSHIEQTVDPIGYTSRHGGYTYGREVVYEDGRWRYITWQEVQRRRKVETQAGFASKLYEIAATNGAHRRFNRALRRNDVTEHAGRYRHEPETYTCEYCSPKTRIFEGIHDIDEFLDYIGKAKLHPHAQVLLDFEL